MTQQQSDTTEYDSIASLGELQPTKFGDLLTHEETEICILHDGRRLYRGSPIVSRPKMTNAGTYMQATVRLELVTDNPDPDKWVATEDVDPVEEEDDTDNENNNKVTFTKANEIDW